MLTKQLRKFSDSHVYIVKIMNPFSEQYKTFSNTDLLRIIENQSDYQPKAVEAAKTEINNRNLSNYEIKDAKNALEAERQEKQKQSEKRTEIEQNIKTLATSFFNTINPIQQSTPTAERQIKLITIAFGLLAIFKWYNQLEFLKFILTDSSGSWDLSILAYFLPLILLPIATLLFWRRKKSGWILITVYLTYSAINAFGFIILRWNRQSLGNPTLDSLFPQVSSISLLLTIFFYGGTVWVLAKKEIREHYNINRQTMIITIATSAILTIMPLLFA